jgi:threonine synthase
VHYICSTCQRQYDLSTMRWKCDCGGFLDLSSPAADSAEFDPAVSGVWRYHSLLAPVRATDRISLGEATTPLLHADALGVLLKLDYMLPSGSYKDRGATALVSRLRDRGVDDIILDSSGNAGAAMSTYSAAAGIGCRVFVPAGNSPAKLAQIAAVGGVLQRVAGTRSDTTRAAREAAQASFYASHNWSPEFAAGLATVAFELWEQLGSRAPSTVLVPCGNGGIVLGLARGFDALLRGGLIPALPRIVAVQSAAYDSVAHAFADRLAEPVPRSGGSSTLAEGIACELPVRGGQVMQAIRDANGSALAVSEARIIEATLALASAGIYVEPTGAVGLAGLLELRASGAAADLGDSVVVILSGSGLKSGRTIADLRSPDWWGGDPAGQATPGAGR